MLYTLQLFSFLPLIKWMAVALVTQRIMHATLEDKADVVLAIEVCL